MLYETKSKISDLFKRDSRETAWLFKPNRGSLIGTLGHLQGKTSSTYWLDVSECINIRVAIRNEFYGRKTDGIPTGWIVPTAYNLNQNAKLVADRITEEFARRGYLGIRVQVRRNT